MLLNLAPGAYTAHISPKAGTGVIVAELYEAMLNPNSVCQRLVNISSRGQVTGGEGVLIGGFVVSGNAPKKLLIRGVSPRLTAFRLSGALDKPRLTVFSEATPLGENDDWSAVATDRAARSTASTQTGAFALTPGSKDASLILTLAPGAYTAQITPADGASSGSALIEIYEIPQ